MKPTLLLVDLQNDFLAKPGLEPTAGELVSRAAQLLSGCRKRSIPIVHVQTTVAPDGHDRMPHWRRQHRFDCVAGTEGHAPPAVLAPAGEPVIEKQWFSGFSNPELETRLGELGEVELIICGVHLHGCVRATALDAYQLGYRVWVAEDAVGSYEGIDAAITRSYLAARAARFARVASLLAMLDGGTERKSDFAGPPPRAESEGQAPAAAAAGARWHGRASEERSRMLMDAADAVEVAGPELAELIVSEVGKPRRYADAEVDRGVALLRKGARLPEPGAQRNSEAEVRRVPLGTVAQITPFNNPLAIPLGKLAPALRYGNSVVWKPSPAAPRTAERLLGLLGEAGCPPGLVSLAHGGADVAEALMNDVAVDAVSLTGSSQAGFSAQAVCGRRRIPLQAELGGNNAAIVWRDSDISGAASALAEAGFGFAGQRCTANRRVIVDQACAAEFVAELEEATASLEIGDPADPGVRIGPLVSEAARDRVSSVVERAAESCELRRPADPQLLRRPNSSDHFLGPSIVLCEDLEAEIAQEETFGPVVVVHRATSFDRALELLNGVRQGLVASLFSSSPELREQFLREAKAGVLKFNQATTDVGVESPFGGWKASGVGPPEHGEANLEFYTRAQAIYG
jgi:alpha-ketoglutaric semialdehyde dehydrogenase